MDSHRIQKLAKDDSVPAMVLGFNSTALGIIRELGRRGIKVVAVDYSKNLGYLSKYCCHYLSPQMEQEPEAYLNFLITLSKKYLNPVLFPSNDLGVLFIVKYYKELEDCFRLTFEKPELIQRIVNKNEFYKLAKDHSIEVPNTLVLDGKCDIAAIGKEMRYPVILKPFVSNAFERRTGKKLVKVNSPTDLEKQYENLHDEFPLMVQEIIPGSDEEQFSCALYMDRAQRPLALFNARKMRCYPIEFGVGTLVESVKENSFTKIALNFLQDIGYVGIAEVEFKRNGLTGQYQMIEINTRSWAQNALAEKLGVPVSYIAYKNSIGNCPEPILKHRSGVRWVSFERDIFSYLEYRKRKMLSARQYLKSLVRVRVFSIFAIDDLMPYLYYFFHLRHFRLYTLLRKLGARLVDLFEYARKGSFGRFWVFVDG